MGVDGLSKIGMGYRQAGSIPGAETVKAPQGKNEPINSKAEKISQGLTGREHIKVTDDFSLELERMLFDDKGQVDMEKLNRTTDLVNTMLKASYRRLDISVHERTKKIMVKIIDTESDKLIREVPPEKTLDILANMWELAGILLDTTG